MSAWTFNHHEIFECAYLKFTVSGQSKQTGINTHTHVQCSHTSVGLLRLAPVSSICALLLLSSSRDITLVGATCYYATQKTLPGELLKPSKYCYYILSNFCWLPLYLGLVSPSSYNRTRLPICYMHCQLQLTDYRIPNEKWSPSKLGHDYQQLL